jgi:hypothetical protein
MKWKVNLCITLCLAKMQKNNNKKPDLSSLVSSKFDSSISSQQPPPMPDKHLSKSTKFIGNRKYNYCSRSLRLQVCQDTQDFVHVADQFPVVVGVVARNKL